MVKTRTASETGRRPHWLSPPACEGGASVAWATAAPLIVLAIAVAADRAQVSRFRTQVQLAADAASLASAATVARNAKGVGVDAAAQVAAAVFARKAPRGAAGSPSVAATSRGPVATATVAYDGVAPSNFGSALGYGAFRVSASATLPALVADSSSAPRP
jgi:Flp pilus assembly protein TadG